MLAGARGSWGTKASTVSWVGKGTALQVVGRWGLLSSSELHISHSVCSRIPKGGLCFVYKNPPVIWFSLAPTWGQKQWNSMESWSCALKSTHTKFIYFSLGWRLGCVFFVQTLFLNSEAKHSLAFVVFFFFLELPFVCIGRKIALLLKISKSVLLLQPWSCCYIKEGKKSL